MANRWHLAPGKSSLWSFVVMDLQYNRKSKKDSFWGKG